MNRLTISAILTASTLLAATAAPNNPTPTITPPQPPLAGYYYGHDTAPRGHEWQSPDSLAYNKLHPRHLLPLPRRTHRHQSPPPHITLHHLPRRTMAIQLGTQPRPTPNPLPVTRLRRLTMGHHTRPLQLEHRRPTTRRHPTLRHTNLRQPTRNLLAPSPPRRLERRRNAHTANRLDHLRPPQRSRIIPPHIHHTQQLAQPTHLHTIRRRRLILLPLDQRPIRRIQQKLTQRRTLQHHTLPQQKRRTP